MTTPHRAALALVVLTALASRAAADPPTHLATSSHVATRGGARLTLPPGYFIDEPTWTKLDAETRRLQDAETRLTAENASLRSSARAFSCDGRCVAVLLVVGLATGVVVGLEVAKL